MATKLLREISFGSFHALTNRLFFHFVAYSFGKRLFAHEGPFERDIQGHPSLPSISRDPDTLCLLPPRLRLHRADRPGDRQGEKDDPRPGLLLHLLPAGQGLPPRPKAGG